MKLISLIIKGDRHTASLASHANGIPFHFEREVKAADYAGVYTIALTTELYRDKVASWYVSAADSQLIEGFGYPLGSLLHYSTIERSLFSPIHLYH